jgi:hypothetical protein
MKTNPKVDFPYIDAQLFSHSFEGILVVVRKSREVGVIFYFTNVEDRRRPIICLRNIFPKLDGVEVDVFRPQNKTNVFNYRQK